MEEERKDSLEEKFKLSLLQIEKRVIDLETTISELSSRLKEVEESLRNKVEETPEVEKIKERIDELEDLIMVEQAGIIELKKMLQKPRRIKLPKAVTEKIKEMEKKISELEKKREETKKSSLGKEVEEIKTSLEELKTKVENSLSIFDEKIKRIESSPVVQTLDIDLFSSRIDELKKNLDKLAKEQLQVDLRIGEWERRFELLNEKLKSSYPGQIVEELKSLRKGLVTLNARTESLERVSRDLIKQVTSLDSSYRKLENLEKIIEINREMENKIERFKLVEDTVRRLSTKVEAIYEELDKKLLTLKNLEESLEDIKEKVSKLDSSLFKKVSKEELEIFKREISSKIEDQLKRTDIENIRKEVKMEIEKIKNEIKKTPQIDTKILDKRFYEMKEKILDLEKKIEILENFLRKIRRIEPLVLE